MVELCPNPCIFWLSSFAMTGFTVGFRYIVFAILAVMINLVAQRFVLFMVAGQYAFYLAVASGTVLGLGVKYYLDKNYIFYDARKGLRKGGMLFFLYSASGIVTTLIFWGAEWSFWILGKTDLMREVGAILGLSVGYLIKYRLDHHFVFNASNLEKAR